VTFVIAATPLAADMISTLRGPVRDAVDAKLHELKARGCEVCGYRLAGPVAERICAVHLRDAYRLLACFPDDQTIVVLLVGEHDQQEYDVYALLARLLELEPPPSFAERTKPPCCDQLGRPPHADDLLDQFEDASRRLRREISRRLRNAQRATRR
jgi:mRNA-degrading endonuclease RelE of RelBE toxin-antitoxin system